MKEWIELAAYFDKDSAIQTIAALRTNNIECIIDDPSNHLNSALGQQTSAPVTIRVAPEDLPKAQELISIYPETDNGSSLDLESYDDDELREIVLRPEEWHRDIVFNAQSLLKKRGITISKEEADIETRKKTEALEQGTAANMLTKYFFWLFALLGGLIGIIGGYFYWRGRIRGFDGKRYYMYNERTRTEGCYMFFTGIISVIVQSYLIMAFA
jgi:hypothetical protein